MIQGLSMEQQRIIIQENANQPAEYVEKLLHHYVDAWYSLFIGVLPVDQYDQPVDRYIYLDAKHPLTSLVLRIYSMEVYVCYTLNAACRA